MIEKLYATNYKSFPKLELEIANINILLGANSCGKSSITNLLLMLSQSADTNDSYHSLFRLNGSKSSLGEAINIFPDKKTEQLLTMGWSLPDGTIKNKRLTMGMLSEFLEENIRTIYFKFRRLDRSNTNNDKVDYQPIRDALEYLSNYYVSFSSYEADIEDSKSYEAFLLKHIRAINKFIKKHIKEHDSLSEIQQISPSKLKDLIETIKVRNSYELNNTIKKIEYQVSYNKSLEECELRRMRIFDSEGNILLEISISDSRKIDIFSEVIDNALLQNSRLDIIKGMDKTSLSLLGSFRFTINSLNPFAQYIRQIITTTCNCFLKELADTKINHVSPLRAFPQRYYLLEKSAQHNTLNANDGSQLAEILKNNPLILEQVNQLFKDFDLKISTAKTNDIIHRITVKQNNVTVELTDVGFGISQVLPILVQALLCPNDSITIIEQPEIHLHPRMQAWLTNAIVKISIKDNKKFIIETHSDTIIKRLQLLMMDPETEFSTDSLNLYHLERQGNGHTSIKSVPLNNLGEISWPLGFMDLEIQDAIKLQELKVNKLRQNRAVSHV